MAGPNMPHPRGNQTCGGMPALAFDSSSPQASDRIQSETPSDVSASGFADPTVCQHATILETPSLGQQREANLNLGRMSHFLASTSSELLAPTFFRYLIKTAEG